MDLINETVFQAEHVKSKTKTGRRLPSGRKRTAYTKMLMGLIYLGLFVVLGGTYNFAAALLPSFAKKSLLTRFVSPVFPVKYIWLMGGVGSFSSKHLDL